MIQTILAHEKDHLGTIRAKLKSAIETMIAQESALAEAMKAANLYLKDEMGSAPGDFLQAVEFSQTLQVEKQLLEQIGYQDQRLLRYHRLMPKPYFARIDFKERGEPQEEQLYIGYGNFMDDQTLEIYIYDWRTPIASVFYDFQTGDVNYMAPDGMIYGHVSLKRQFDIKNGKLIAYHDTQLHIADEKLLEALAARTSGPMHQIVETIQAEQNSIIREKKAAAVFVEGIAGSGKTVVALHRIAYLLYHGLKNSLTSQHVLVLSPNDLFSDYIAHVIPELGEEQVLTKTLLEVLNQVVQPQEPDSEDPEPQAFPCEHPYSLLEKDLQEGLSPKFQKQLKIKQSPQMANLLIDWIQEFQQTYMPYQDFYYGEERLATAASMRRALEDDSKNRPLMKRMGRFAERVRQRVKDHEKAYYSKLLLEIMESGKHPFDYKAAARLARFKTYRTLSQSLDAVLAISASEVYRQLLNHPQFWVKYFETLTLEGAQILCQDTLERMGNGDLTVDDWVLIAYLQVGMHGDHALLGLKQVVVDESQDYSLMTFALMKKMFPKAHFTVLGDFHQTLQGIRKPSHHQRVSEILKFEDAVHKQLSVSYRNSQAIGQLCLGLFKSEAGYDMVPRKGEKPLLFKGSGAMIEAIDHLKAAKLETIAVITKTMEQAQVVYQALQNQGDLQPHLMTIDSFTLPKGLLVMPVYLAKGMEFDGVVIADVDSSNYVSERDRQLLYICASRALHGLALTLSDDRDLSGFLEGLI